VTNLMLILDLTILLLEAYWDEKLVALVLSLHL
jgi:hypothetical protein